MNTFSLSGMIAWAVFIPLAASADSQVSSQGQTTQAYGQGSVEVRIEGVPSTTGLVYVSLFLSPDGFPDAIASAYDNRSFPATSEPIVFRYPAIPAGRFVLSVFHDVDGNKVLSTNFIGIPKEVYGFSQNAKGRFGPPPFDKAAVMLAEGETKSLVIQLH